MVQATFDDLNPETAKRWAYADTGKWDAERNVREFIAAMPEWKRHGLLAVTVNFQGGSPEGYSQKQAWETGAFTADGGLRPEFADRMRRVLDAADEQGMVVILGYFYFGQDQRLRDEAAVLRATDEATRWLLDGGWRNVLVEVNNETNVTAYDHDILRPDRVHELITRVCAMTERATAARLLVGTSYGGGAVPNGKRRARVGLPAASWQRREQPRPHHGDGAPDPRRARLPADADPVQRGRSRELRPAGEQLHGRHCRARLVGLVRLSPEGRGHGGGLSVSAGELGHQLRDASGRFSSYARKSRALETPDHGIGVRWILGMPWHSES